MRALAFATLLALTACGSVRAPAPDAGRTTSIPTPEQPTKLRVDHAWVKDAARPVKQAAQRKAIDALRAKVAAGEGFNAAWQSLRLDGTPWHVAEGETYDREVIPEAVRDLAPGTVSPVVPGNGGLHLFRILEPESPS
jgi:PPIC-type PPIASE domain